MLPKPIQQFIDRFSRLPSLGPRLATRLAFHMIGLDRASLNELERALAGLKTLHRCERCFFLREEKKTLCDICTNRARDPGRIAIVEKETDVIALEKTGKFHGHYLVLGELPEKGILESVHKLRLGHLKVRIAKELGGRAKEIIIALNPNTFGDFMADMIHGEFKDAAETITRLGRGIPTGGEVEFADEETLSSALERRN